jgi:hypothetical protein
VPGQLGIVLWVEVSLDPSRGGTLLRHVAFFRVRRDVDSQDTRVPVLPFPSQQI